MLTNFFQVVFLLVRMLLAGEAVEFIQFDIFRADAGDDLLIGGLGLDAGAVNLLDMSFPSIALKLKGVE